MFGGGGAHPLARPAVTANYAPPPPLPCPPEARAHPSPLAVAPLPQATTDRRLALLQFVQRVEPSLLRAVEGQAPPPVLDAMRQTVTNLVGTLPPQFFRVTISTQVGAGGVVGVGEMPVVWVRVWPSPGRGWVRVRGGGCGGGVGRGWPSPGRWVRVRGGGGAGEGGGWGGWGCTGWVHGAQCMGHGWRCGWGRPAGRAGV